MEFEEMQVIWNNQESEKLYAINEEAMFAMIRRKGGKTRTYLAAVDWILLAVNLFVSAFLLYTFFREQQERWELILPVMYFAYALGTVYFRRRRRRSSRQFPETMIGELDKAIWQVDYLVKQGYNLLLWYLLPLTAVLAIFVLQKGWSYWVFPAMIAFLAGTFFAMRLENARWHLPKKRELESLRQALLADEING